MKKWIAQASLCLAVCLLANGLADAQTRRKKTDEKPVVSLPPVTLVNNPAPEYLSGEVSVAVRANENPLVRLGLAQHGVALVEFPASDRFFAINPGNPDLVTIEDSPTKTTDHFFVMRPGTSFLPAFDHTKTSAPATSLIVQMTSGMVVTFVLYPIREIERNAHRCVISYDREAVVNARKAAGLAVNLDQREEVAKQKLPASIRVATAVDANSENAMATGEPNVASIAPVPLAPFGPYGLARADPNEEPAWKHFGTEKLRWSKAAHGLLVTAQARIVDAQQREVWVAVRNTTKQTIQIVPGHPELYVQTLDGKGRVLQAEPVMQLKAEATHVDGLIAPGQTARYRLVYEPPMLGARQKLGVAVAQTQAADEPAMMELSAQLK